MNSRNIILAEFTDKDTSTLREEPALPSALWTGKSWPSVGDSGVAHVRVQSCLKRCQKEWFRTGSIIKMYKRG